VTAIDNIYDYWPKGMFNRHFYVIQDDITHTGLTKKFDLITCVSVLEHIPNYKAAVQSMFNCLHPRGHLVLTFPYNEKKYIENVYKIPGAGYGQDAPQICQVFSRNELDNLMKTNNGLILEQEYWEVFTGDFWTFGERLYPPRQVDKSEIHQLTCILCQKQ
jgi:SAM-dependent methyltransferase